MENYTTPLEVDYSLDDLKSFLAKDLGELVICFYGGEPCLRVDLMEKIMNEISPEKYVLQTNGTKLDRLPVHVLKKFDTILVSIDGQRELNDGNRGKGNHDEVLDKSALIRERGFTGDLIARMTVSEETAIDKEVTYLLELTDPVEFNHVHWQLDVFWTGDRNWHDLKSWVNRVYNPGITKLAEYWIEKITKGIIPGIVPFQGVMKTLLAGKPVTLPCGAGNDFFAINTSGLITACPISPDMEEMHVGDISSSDPENLRGCISVGEPCLSCEYYGICGGRCLFANKTNLWGREDFNLVCQTVKHLVNEMKKIQPLIEDLIADGTLKREDFDYPSYNNSCEIIP